MIDAGQLNQVVERLRVFAPRRIILYGSQARGTARADSDIDLLVICPTPGSRYQLLVAMERALRGIRLPTELMVLSPDEFDRTRDLPGSIAYPAAREGITLYDAA